MRLPDERTLLTLRDAADDIMKLPKAEQQHEKWQTAIRCLSSGAADGRDFMMHAHVGVMRALNRHVTRQFKTGEKKTHRGKPKLAQEQASTSHWIDTDRQFGLERVSFRDASHMLPNSEKLQAIGKHDDVSC